MKKVDTVISLVYSLSKSEKKYFFLHVVKENPGKDYLEIYDIIVNGKISDGRQVRAEFYRRRPDGSFEVSIQYLYERLLDTLLSLRKKKDNWYDLYSNICKARMLFERSLFHECFELLDETIEQAKYYENSEIFLVAQKLQLEFLSHFNYSALSLTNIREKYQLQYEAIEKMKSLTDQLSSYTLLRYAFFNQPETEGLLNKKPDIVMNGSFEGFKKHLLSQAFFYINKKEYAVAVQKFKELIFLFEENKHLWCQSPFYYQHALERILEGLRLLRLYDEMPFFTGKLKELITGASHEFEINGRCLTFLYEIVPYLDRGNFAKCKELMENNPVLSYLNNAWLSHVRKNELLLHLSLIHLGNQDYRAAEKQLSQITFYQNPDYVQMIRVIRLVRLILLYERGEQELIQQESRLIRRGVTLKKERAYRTEYRLLWFINKRDLPVLKKDRERLWEKLLPECKELYQDTYENRLLNIFDFVAWIKSKLLRKPLSEVLAEKENHYL